MLFVFKRISAYFSCNITSNLGISSQNAEEITVNRTNLVLGLTLPRRTLSRMGNVLYLDLLQAIQETCFSARRIAHPPRFTPPQRRTPSQPLWFRDCLSVLSSTHKVLPPLRTPGYGQVRRCIDIYMPAHHRCVPAF